MYINDKIVFIVKLIHELPGRDSTGTPWDPQGKTGETHQDDD